MSKLFLLLFILFVSCEGERTTYSKFYLVNDSGVKVSVCPTMALTDSLLLQKGEIKEVLAPALNNLTLHTEFHEGGYAKTTDRLITLIKNTAAQTGILFDQVYTGKMLLAALHLVESRNIKEGEKLLLLHTGGTLGWLSQE